MQISLRLEFLKLFVFDFSLSSLGKEKKSNEQIKTVESDNSNDVDKGWVRN